MAIDNTLWSGRVLDEDDDSEATRAIRELNDRIAADERVDRGAADGARRRDARPQRLEARRAAKASPLLLPILAR